jgi:hypothetical protein
MSFNTEELEYVLEYVNSRDSWKFGHSSGNSEHIQTPFFSTMDLPEYFGKYLHEKIGYAVNKRLAVDRNYMHVQMFGQDGCYHIDSASPNAFTFCIYFTEIGAEDIELAKGEFFVKPPDTNCVVSIDTQHNRGVFFPSTYPHKGMAYNRSRHEKRVCITWKMTEIF